MITAGRGPGGRARPRVVAYARAFPMRQWWGGRSCRWPGIAGVVVAPEQRGRGVGSLLMRALLDRAAELGDACRCCTRRRCRSTGGSAGSSPGPSTRSASTPRCCADWVGPRSPCAPRTPTMPRRWSASPGRAPPVAGQRTAGPRRRRRCEPCSPTPRRSATWPTTGSSGTAGRASDLRVHELTAASGPTARALWSVVGSGASVARTVHAYVGPRDPLHLMLGEAVRHRRGTQIRWMLRVLDLPAAVPGARFPPAVAGAVTLAVDDPWAPRNSGSWRLTVADGAGEVVARRPDADALRLDAGAGGAVRRAAGVDDPGRRAGDRRAAGGRRGPGRGFRRRAVPARLLLIAPPGTRSAARRGLASAGWEQWRRA